MINIKKGTGHSLAQSDFLGTVTVDPITRAVTPTIVAGQIVSKTGSSDAIVSGIDNLTDQVGFAITDTSEGDAKESKKVGAYALDGNTVVETDQVVESVDYTNFPHGAPVYAVVGNTNRGKVTADDGSGDNLLIGTTDSIRTVYVGQTPYTVLGIKLA
jgi:hypothetical protein